MYSAGMDFREALLRQERAAASRMVRAYGEAWGRIQSSLDDLMQQAAEARARGEAVGEAWMWRYGRLEALQAQVKAEIDRFAEVAAIEISAGQRAAINAGAKNAEQLMALGMGPAPEGVSFPFHRMNRAAVEQMVGMAGDGAPLGDWLGVLGADAKKRATDALVEGLMLGQGPEAVARRMRDALGGNMARALTIARTETLRAYREATRATYAANSDVVQGWRWASARNDRTCAACWAMDGKVFETDTPMGTHPNCRCSLLPNTKTWAELGFDVPEPKSDIPETGAEAFALLSSERQRAILGEAGQAAYASGAVALGDFVRVTRSEVWGVRHSERGLHAILGDAAAYFTGRGERIMGHTWYSTEISPALKEIEEARRAGQQLWGWEDSARKLRQMAAQDDVRVQAIERVFGLWGSPEPSFRTELLGSRDNVKALAEHLRFLYAQEAVAVLIPQKGGEGGILRWSFDRPLTDAELNTVLDSLRAVFAETGEQIGLTARGNQLEYWFGDESSRMRGAELLKKALERAGLHSTPDAQIIGYEFFLALGG